MVLIVISIIADNRSIHEINASHMWITPDMLALLNNKFGREITEKDMCIKDEEEEEEEEAIVDARNSANVSSPPDSMSSNVVTKMRDLELRYQTTYWNKEYNTIKKKWKNQVLDSEKV